MEPSGESLTRKQKCLYNLTASKRKLLSPSCVNGLHADSLGGENHITTLDLARGMAEGE